MSEILLNAFELEPEKAIEYFEAKGYTISWNWQDTWQEAHAKAFTVAKATNLDVLKDIRGMVEKALNEGITLRRFQHELIPQLQAKGWWGRQELVTPEGETETVQLGSPWRLKTIYRTNLSVAYSVGKYKSMLDVAKKRPYWQYLITHKPHNRISHKKHYMKVYRFDHSFWDVWYPPNDWYCGCHVRSLSERQLRSMGLKVETAMPSDQPGKGWQYNPGKAAWQPDLDQYEYETARKYIDGAVSGPDYARFISGDSEGVYPVAVLNASMMEKLNMSSQTIYYDSKSHARNRKKHPDLSADDYQLFPTLFDDADDAVVKKDKKKYIVSGGEYELVVSGGKVEEVRSRK